MDNTLLTTSEALSPPRASPEHTPPAVATLAAIVALCGALVTLLAPFLSWLDVSLLGAHGSMSGVGTLRGSVVGLARDGSAGIHDGIVLVVLGSIVAIATAAILDRRVRAPQATFILILLDGLAGLGLMVFEWNSLSGRIAGMYSTIADSSAQFTGVHGGSDAVSTLGSATPGIGLYLSFLGTGLIVLGAVLWFVRRPREGIAPQP